MQTHTNTYLSLFLYLSLSLSLYIYVYIYICMYIYLYVYIYIYWQQVIYINLIKDYRTFLFYDLLFFSLAFLLVSLYQGPIDREVALGSAPNCFCLYCLIVLKGFFCKHCLFLYSLRVIFILLASWWKYFCYCVSASVECYFIYVWLFIFNNDGFEDLSVFFCCYFYL